MFALTFQAFKQLRHKPLKIPVGQWADFADFWPAKITIHLIFLKILLFRILEDSRPFWTATPNLQGFGPPPAPGLLQPIDIMAFKSYKKR
jgi:hypothetical protein